MNDIISQIENAPVERQRELLALASKIQEKEQVEAARSSFLAFVKWMMPTFVNGKHHQRMAKEFDALISGDNDRLLVTLGPRHSKSMMTSIFFIAFYFGHYPEHFVIQATHNADLAQDFGRDVRNMVATERYRKVFPNTHLQPDTKAAGRWNTTRGGKYFAIGVGGKLAGKGAHLLVIDDASSEQDYIRSLGGDTTPFDDTYEWYQTGPRQRLQPGAKICVVGTRWHVRDLMGRLIKRMTSNPKADQWRIIEFPAILPSGKPLWPEFWSLEELERTKAELSSQQWEAQYQQNPVSEISSIIKRDWWRIWPHDEPPKCEYVIQSWDTAYLKPDNRAAKRKKPDYSARTDWGIFYADNEEGIREPNIILLDAWKEQVEFPQLKARAKKDYDKVKPDVLLVEAKASGIPLVQELRMAGVPAVDVGQARGSRANPNDKISRVHNIADIFKQGKVWRPERKFAEEVAEECAAFPAGDFDDYVDTTTQALNRFRQGGFITLKTDEDDDDWFPKKKADYY